ncbi:Nucleolar Complex 2 protein [Coemansia sp. IMI 203386]|nr:Nucleolar Complex 2 protein [Coemansia sp. IMI 203386]
MGKVKKSTKKFNKNHLKGELERRNKFKKTKQLIKKREQKKGKKTGSGHDEQSDEEFTGIEEVDNLAEFAESSLKGAGANMDVSKFMEADPNNDDSSDASDSEDIDALLSEGDDDSDNDEMATGLDNEEPDSDDEESFKEQFESMKEKDPEFFKFMQSNDPGFLETMEEAIDEEDNDEESDDEDNEDTGKDGNDNDDVEMDDDKGADKSKSVLVTAKMLESWEKDVASKHSLRSFRRLLLAFYSASHMNSEGDSSNKMPFRIEGMTVFNKTVATAIRVAPGAFKHYAPIEGGKINRKASGKKWNVVQALVKSYLSSLLELMRQMSDVVMVQYLIKECERMIPYYGCFVRFTRDLVKELLRQFGSTSADDSVRILSLLVLRQLVSVSGTEITDMALKGIYLTYVRSSNLRNISSLTKIQLMRNCGVELYGNDANASYQHAFVYIRQLAIHLRNSMQLRSKESFRAIYNWQFINSLHFWTEVLATYCGDRADEQPEFCATLESLVYPLTQILLGVVRLVPTAKFFPLRIHCLEQLVRLSSATGVYIPILPMIIEMLESPEFLSRRPIKSTLKRPQFEALLKAPGQYDHTRVYLEVVLEHAFDLLADAFASQSVRIAFPEWSVPAVLQVKRWRKRVGQSWPKFSKQLQGLLDKVEQTSRMVQQRRGKVDFGPANLTGANQFMSDVGADETPIGAYAASLRKVRAQQRATLVEAETNDE